MTIEFYVSKSHHYTQARRFARCPADFPVRVRGDGVRVNDRAADISEVGLRIETDRPLSPMTLISIRLELPHGLEPVDMLGRVMWAKEHMMGVRFEQTDPRLSDAVERLRQDTERI